MAIWKFSYWVKIRVGNCEVEKPVETGTRTAADPIKHENEEHNEDKEK